MSEITIKLVPNGPGLILTEESSKPLVAICMCGKSNSYPNCDGTHKECGYQSKGGEVKVSLTENTINCCSNKEQQCCQSKQECCKSENQGCSE